MAASSDGRRWPCLLFTLPKKMCVSPISLVLSCLRVSRRKVKCDIKIREKYIAIGQESERDSSLKLGRDSLRNRKADICGAF